MRVVHYIFPLVIAFSCKARPDSSESKTIIVDSSIVESSHDGYPGVKIYWTVVTERPNGDYYCWYKVRFTDEHVAEVRKAGAISISNASKQTEAHIKAESVRLSQHAIPMSALKSEIISEDKDVQAWIGGAGAPAEAFGLFMWPILRPIVSEGDRARATIAAVTEQQIQPEKVNVVTADFNFVYLEDSLEELDDTNYPRCFEAAELAKLPRWQQLSGAIKVLAEHLVAAPE